MAKLIFATGKAALNEIETLPYYSRTPALTVEEITKNQLDHTVKIQLRLQLSDSSDHTLEFAMAGKKIEMHYLFKTESFHHRWFEMAVIFLFIQVLDQTLFVLNI
jgi:hypothetical protein